MTESTHKLPQPDELTLLRHDVAVHAHQDDVRANMLALVTELLARAQAHDASKMQSPEREVYAVSFPKLAATEYGSPEYQALLAETKVAIDNHYSKNRHHPEHWPNGIDDMDLIDLLELIADWTSATKRNKNGNIHKSIEKNTERYKMTAQLARILRNTVERYF